MNEKSNNYLKTNFIIYFTIHIINLTSNKVYNFFTFMKLSVKIKNLRHKVRIKIDNSVLSVAYYFADA